MKHILTKEAERRGLIYIFSCMFLAGLFVALYCNRPMQKPVDYADVHKIDTLHSELPDTSTGIGRVTISDTPTTLNRIRYAKDY